MSINHQFINLQDNVCKRYVKTEIATLSGKRVDPHNLHEQMPFLLITPESKIKYSTTKQGDLDIAEFDGRDPEIDYDNEVLEVYSEKEDKIFRSLNKALFEKGLLVTYDHANGAINMQNALTENEIEAIARMPQPMKFRSRLKTITSHATLNRIREHVIRLDRPMRFIRELDDYANSIIT